MAVPTLIFNVLLLVSIKKITTINQKVSLTDDEPGILIERFCYCVLQCNVVLGAPSVDETAAVNPNPEVGTMGEPEDNSVELTLHDPLGREGKCR